MNMVTHNTDVVPQLARRSIAIPAARPPVYVRLMLMVLAAMVVLTAGWTTLFRPGTPLSNPFSDYGEILPGQLYTAIAGAQFSCDPGGTEYCSRTLTSGRFSLVSVSLSDGVVSRVNFSVQEGALTVGDLALLWGRPNVRRYRQSVNLEWPGIGVSANGWAESWQFSYSVPVQRISFAPPS